MAPLSISRLLLSRKGSKTNSSVAPPLDSPQPLTDSRLTTQQSDASADLADFEAALSAIEASAFSSSSHAADYAPAGEVEPYLSPSKSSVIRCGVLASPRLSRLSSRLFKRASSSAESVANADPACPIASSKRADAATGRASGCDKESDAASGKNSSCESLPCSEKSPSFTDSVALATRSAIRAAVLKSRAILSSPSSHSSARSDRAAEGQIREEETAAEDPFLGSSCRCAAPVTHAGDASARSVQPAEEEVKPSAPLDAPPYDAASLGAGEKSKALTVSAAESHAYATISSALHRDVAGGKNRSSLGAAGGLAVALYACRLGEASSRKTCHGPSGSTSAPDGEQRARSPRRRPGDGSQARGGVSADRRAFPHRCQHRLWGSSALSSARSEWTAPMSSARMEKRSTPPVVPIASPRLRPPSYPPASFVALRRAQETPRGDAVPAAPAATQCVPPAVAASSAAAGTREIEAVSSDGRGSDAASSTSSIVIFESEDSLDSPTAVASRWSQPRTARDSPLSLEFSEDADIHDEAAAAPGEADEADALRRAAMLAPQAELGGLADEHAEAELELVNEAGEGTEEFREAAAVDLDECYGDCSSDGVPREAFPFALDDAETPGAARSAGEQMPQGQGWEEAEDLTEEVGTRPVEAVAPEATSEPIGEEIAGTWHAEEQTEACVEAEATPAVVAGAPATRCPECSLYLPQDELQDHLFAHALDALQAQAARRERRTKTREVSETFTASVVAERRIPENATAVREAGASTEAGRSTPGSRSTDANLDAAAEAVRCESTAQPPTAPETTTEFLETPAAPPASPVSGAEEAAGETPEEAGLLEPEALPDRAAPVWQTRQRRNVEASASMRQRSVDGPDEEGEDERTRSLAPTSSESLPPLGTRSASSPRQRVLQRAQSLRVSGTSSVGSRSATASRLASYRSTAAATSVSRSTASQRPRASSGADAPVTSSRRAQTPTTCSTAASTHRGAHASLSSGAASGGGRATPSYMGATAASRSRRTAARTASRFAPSDNESSWHARSAEGAGELSLDESSRRSSDSVTSQRGGAGALSRSRRSAAGTRRPGTAVATGGSSASSAGVRRLTGAVTARQMLTSDESRGSVARSSQTHRSTLCHSSSEESVPRIRSLTRSTPHAASTATVLYSGLATSRGTVGSFSYRRAAARLQEQRRAACAAAAVRRAEAAAAAAAALAGEPPGSASRSQPSSDGYEDISRSQSPPARPSVLRSASMQLPPPAFMGSRRTAGVVGSPGSRGGVRFETQGSLPAMSLSLRRVASPESSSASPRSRLRDARETPEVPTLTLSSLHHSTTPRNPSQVHTLRSLEAAGQQRVVASPRERASAAPSSDEADSEQRTYRAASARGPCAGRSYAVVEADAGSSTGRYYGAGAVPLSSAASRRSVGVAGASEASARGYAGGAPARPHLSTNTSGWVPTWGQTLIDMGLVPSRATVGARPAASSYRRAEQDEERAGFGRSIGAESAERSPTLSTAAPGAASLTSASTATTMSPRRAAMSRSTSVTYGYQNARSMMAASARSPADARETHYRHPYRSATSHYHSYGGLEDYHLRGSDPGASFGVGASAGTVSRGFAHGPSAAADELEGHRGSMTARAAVARPGSYSAAGTLNSARAASTSPHLSSSRLPPRASTSALGGGAAAYGGGYARQEWRGYAGASSLSRSEGGQWAEAPAGPHAHRYDRRQHFQQQEEMDPRAVEAHHRRMEEEENERRGQMLQVLIDLLPTSEFNQERSANLSEEAKKCSICFEEYEHGEEQRRLPCTHVFHKNCIDMWLRRSFVCPICKHDLRSAFE
ncbi:zinc finger, C3HC4 type (RING finger) domain-containing protein [Besnoitia besnoiti]|uniref:Zinc finger, C3HC4 type (RING finger) domain-containing protein n=1 Tax=Besnoitia besnoiti TaxID=94643 RepID=A0A2A9ME41_BESBE|nr:zinc finger, C3HC4 type (RING finger) domain-containing protein [Besnoitia besnoiti]PFH33652.1 zinc finger, C3HC4 type (RING finger) domain-containing protein [Besnoitia besnoiti]